MAHYLELYGKASDNNLQNRLAVAIAVKAQALFDAASPTASQIAWSQEAIANPHAKAEPFLRYLLAKNRALTLAQIDAVSDADLQTAVGALVDKIVAGGTP